MVYVLGFVAIALIAVITRWVLRAANRPRNSAGSDTAEGSSQVVGARDAAQRTLCLASILARTNLEYGLKFDSAATSADGSDNEIFHRNQRRWMEEQGLWNGLSSTARTLLEKPVGTC